MEKFQKAIEFTLPWEAGRDRNGKIREDGGLVVDTGGVTKWGISERANPGVDIRNLTKEQAIGIYRIKYWSALGCDNMEIGLAIAVFDSGVNCGVGRTAGWLKQIRNNPSKVADESRSLIDLRNAHYFNLESIDKAKYGKFVKGWLNRTNDLKKYIDIIRNES